MASARRPSSNAARMRVEDTVWPQPFDIAGRPRAEGKVIAAEKFPRTEAVDEHLLHEIFRRQTAEGIERRFLILLDAQGRNAGVLLRQREDAPALQGAAVGQLKGKGGGSQALFCGTSRSRAQHGTVTAVDAVKIAERHGTALRGVDRRQALVDLHWLSAPFAK